MASPDTPGHPAPIGAEFVGRAALSDAAVHLPIMQRVGVRQPQHAQHSTGQTFPVATSLVVSHTAAAAPVDGCMAFNFQVASDYHPHPEVMALMIAIGMDAPIRVAAAAEPTYTWESGGERVYTYHGIFKITEHRMCDPPFQPHVLKKGRKYINN
eukprot:jgi/Ulvmu1/7216/UM035_0002.1